MKMNKTLLLVTLLTPIIAGCAGSNNPQGERIISITDMQNRTMDIDLDKVDRVICLGAGALRYYSYVGDVSKLVAVEEIDNKPFGVGTALRPYYHVNKDLFGQLPTCGKGGPASQTPEKEKIISNNPNIIISFYSDAGVNDDLASTLKIPVVALKQGANGIYDDVTINSLKLLGKIFNKEDRVNDLVSYINASKTELDGLGEVATNYYAGCIGNWGQTNLYGTFANFPVFKFAHVSSKVDELMSESKQTKIDTEKLVEMNPEKIFLDGAGVAGFIDNYNENKETYEALDAFKNGEIYSLLPYNAYYTNLEIQMMSTYYVASVAHPEAFPNFNIENKCNEISSKFLNKNIYNEMKEYPTSLGGYQKLNIQELINE